MSKGRLLLINLWVEPIGLISIGSFLGQHGYGLDFIDCLNRYNPDLLKLQRLSVPAGNAYDKGVHVKLAEFTPIPGTVEWERAREVYGFDPNSDPLLHNNRVFSLTIGHSRLEEWNRVKQLASDGNCLILQFL